MGDAHSAEPSSQATAASEREEMVERALKFFKDNGWCDDRSVTDGLMQSAADAILAETATLRKRLGELEGELADIRTAFGNAQALDDCQTLADKARKCMSVLPRLDDQKNRLTCERDAARREVEELRAENKATNDSNEKRYHEIQKLKAELATLRESAGQGKVIERFTNGSGTSVGYEWTLEPGETALVLAAPDAKDKGKDEGTRAVDWRDECIIKDISSVEAGPSWCIKFGNWHMSCDGKWWDGTRDGRPWTWNTYVRAWAALNTAKPPPVVSVFMRAIEQHGKEIEYMRKDLDARVRRLEAKP